MSANIKKVAEWAGVSTATVSHVINETRFVAEETKQKVLQAMKELDYRPNSVARSLRSQRSKIIGLIVPVLSSDTSNYFFMEVAQGIEQVLKLHGYNLILSNSNEDIEVEKEQIKVLNSQLIDGLIIAPTASSQSYLHEALSDKYPVVFVDRKPEEYEGDCILADGFTGTYEAVSLLIQKDHKQIGYISGALGITTSDERLNGYRQALQDHGLDLKDDLIRIGSATFESGYELTKQLVQQHSISALFIANNIMTMGAMRFLQDIKINIPENLAVIGFDDYEWGRVVNPPLSVISQPSFELGCKAAEVLLQRINGSDIPYKEYRLSTELILRSSC